MDVAGPGWAGCRARYQAAELLRAEDPWRPPCSAGDLGSVKVDLPQSSLSCCPGTTDTVELSLRLGFWSLRFSLSSDSFTQQPAVNLDLYLSLIQSILGVLLPSGLSPAPQGTGPLQSCSLLSNHTNFLADIHSFSSPSLYTCSSLCLHIPSHLP